MRNTITLITIDGFGLSASSTGNAFAVAAAPNLSELFSKCPSTTLSAFDAGEAQTDAVSPDAGYYRMGSGRRAAPHPVDPLKNTLGEWIASMGLRQTRICAESARHASIYSFNGYSDAPFPNERDIVVAGDAALAGLRRSAFSIRRRRQRLSHRLLLRMRRLRTARHYAACGGRSRNGRRLPRYADR